MRCCLLLHILKVSRLQVRVIFNGKLTFDVVKPFGLRGTVDGVLASPATSSEAAYWCPKHNTQMQRTYSIHVSRVS